MRSSVRRKDTDVAVLCLQSDQTILVSWQLISSILPICPISTTPPEDQRAMLEAIGVGSIDELVRIDSGRICD